jgi:hypothetical protein
MAYSKLRRTTSWPVAALAPMGTPSLHAHPTATSPGTWTLTLPVGSIGDAAWAVVPSNVSSVARSRKAGLLTPFDDRHTARRVRSAVCEATRVTETGSRAPAGLLAISVVCSGRCIVVSAVPGSAQRGYFQRARSDVGPGSMPQGRALCYIQWAHKDASVALHCMQVLGNGTKPVHPRNVALRGVSAVVPRKAEKRKRSAPGRLAWSRQTSTLRSLCRQLRTLKLMLRSDKCAVMAMLSVKGTLCSKWRSQAPYSCSGNGGMSAGMGCSCNCTAARNFAVRGFGCNAGTSSKVLATWPAEMLTPVLEGTAFKPLVTGAGCDHLQTACCCVCVQLIALRSLGPSRCSLQISWKSADRTLLAKLTRVCAANSCETQCSNVNRSHVLPEPSRSLETTTLVSLWFAVRAKPIR